jgi:hypothetical protein
MNKLALEEATEILFWRRAFTNLGRDKKKSMLEKITM